MPMFYKTLYTKDVPFMIDEKTIQIVQSTAPVLKRTQYRKGIDSL